MPSLFRPLPTPLPAELHDRIEEVEEELLSDPCPRCGTACESDTRGGECFSIACDCGCHFCAWCLTDCGDDAHEHVAHCQRAGGDGDGEQAEAGQERMEGESGEEEEDGDEEEQEEEGEASRIGLRDRVGIINYAESGGQPGVKGKGRKRGPGRRKGSLNDSDALVDDSSDDEDTVLVPFLVYDRADKHLKTPSDFEGGFAAVLRNNVGWLCLAVLLVLVLHPHVLVSTDRRSLCYSSVKTLWGKISWSFLKIVTKAISSRTSRVNCASDKISLRMLMGRQSMGRT